MTGLARRYFSTTSALTCISNSGKKFLISTQVLHAGERAQRASKAVPVAVAVLVIALVALAVVVAAAPLSKA